MRTRECECVRASAGASAEREQATHLSSPLRFEISSLLSFRKRGNLNRKEFHHAISKVPFSISFSICFFSSERRMLFQIKIY